MDVRFTEISRTFLCAVLILTVLKPCETFTVTSKPNNPTVVVEGVNSSRVVLKWSYKKASSETIRSVSFIRQRPGKTVETKIATRSRSGRFKLNKNEFKARYKADSPSTLVLLNVINSEEFSYILRVSYRTSAGVRKSISSKISVVVFVPPIIRVNPARKAGIEAGQNVTLTCIASGDPVPSITWTKDGVSQDHFNVSGHKLHLVNLQRKDVGSYRCTASNRYGSDASSASIVGVNCNHCHAQRVNITMTSEVWNGTLSNRESIEFKKLESNLLSAISRVYTSYAGKQLYRLVVEAFSPGSVVATVVLMFERSTCEPLKPLQDEIATAKLGQFTVHRQLLAFPPVLSPTTLPSSSTVLQMNSSTITRIPADMEADSEWTRQRFILHVIYLSVICVLVVTIIVLLVLRLRRPSVKDLTRVTSYRCYDLDEQKPIQDEGTALQETSTYVNIQNGAQSLSQPTSPSSDVGQQSIYEACNYVPPNGRKSWEVRRENVCIVKEIGKGAFSQVAKAEAWNVNGIKGLTTVAVKMLKGNAPDSDRKDLLSELELMKQLKPHPHVIKLMGCITESDPLLVLIEYIPYGDLLGFLRKSRGLKDTYFKNPDVKPQTNLTPQQMMQFAWQIADGMSYLSSCKIIHRDLAARNVLVGEGEKCKVTDFGMARDVQQDDIYTKQSRGRLPVKWTAYEALLYGTYTTQSDVWSFGVVLYEIFTVGGSPYPGINGRDIANKLKTGYRMPKPKHVDQQLYQLMLHCWQQKPQDRPTFSELKDKMTKMLQNNKETYANMQEYDTSDYGYIDDLLE